MPDAKVGRKTDTKGTCTDRRKANKFSDTTCTSETDSEWKSPLTLKQEVQTIIDIMGPSLSPHLICNTSSEADNEESIYTESKLSNVADKCDCDEKSADKTSVETSSKNDDTDAACPMSTAADINTTSFTDDLTEEYQRAQYVCPPPLVPANLHCLNNSDCVCPQVATLLREMNQMVGIDSGDVMAPKCRKEPNAIKSGVANWLKTMVMSSKSLDNAAIHKEYYKMNVKRTSGDDKSPPRRVVFELVDELDKPKETCHDTVDTCPVKTKKNLKNQRLQTRADINCRKSEDVCRTSKKPVEKTTYCDSTGRTRVDVYYFDHGSFNHYETTDAPPLVTTEDVAEKTEQYTTRFWAEIFGTLHIGLSFVTSFILQFVRFLLYSLCRPLTIGFVQLMSDYFFKPLLVTCFNGIIQPILIFVYNVIASVRDICDPIAEGIGYFLRELAVLVRAFRLVEVNRSDQCGKRDTTNVC